MLDSNIKVKIGERTFNTFTFLWVGSCTAIRREAGWTNVQHFASAIACETREDAHQSFKLQAHEKFPVAEGWTSHTVSFGSVNLTVPLDEKVVFGEGQ